MSWNQFRRSGYNLYLDGLVTGGVLAWLAELLYGHVKREVPSEKLRLGLLIAALTVILTATVINILELRKQTDGKVDRKSKEKTQKDT